MCTTGGSARRTYLPGFTTEHIGKVLGGTFHTQTSSFLFKCMSSFATAAVCIVWVGFATPVAVELRIDLAQALLSLFANTRGVGVVHTKGRNVSIVVLCQSTSTALSSKLLCLTRLPLGPSIVHKFWQKIRRVLRSIRPDCAHRRCY